MEDKKISPIRIVLFIIFVGLAFYFFVSGVYRLTNQKPGVYALEAATDKEAATYAHGIDVSYYFDGSSNYIKQKKREAEAVYSGALLRMYKLTDSAAEYEGFTNIATINKSIGTDVKVNDELYEILEDAYKKTSLGESYSIFAGAYYEHWNSILSLDDPTAFDPLFNPDEASRLEALRMQVTDKTNFKLTFKGDNTVRLDVSDSYLKYLEESEESATVLDLNLLRQAYMIKYVAKALTDKGFTKGRITTEEGIYIDLGDYGTGGYAPAEITGGQLRLADPIPVDKGECMTGISALPAGEATDCYYTATKDSQTYYRFPFPTLKEGGFPNYVGSSYVKSHASDNIVNAMYVNILLNSATDNSEVKRIIDGAENFECYVFEIK